HAWPADQHQQWHSEPDTGAAVAGNPEADPGSVRAEILGPFGHQVVPALHRRGHSAAAVAFPVSRRVERGADHYRLARAWHELVAQRPHASTAGTTPPSRAADHFDERWHHHSTAWRDRYRA